MEVKCLLYWQEGEALLRQTVTRLENFKSEVPHGLPACPSTHAQEVGPDVGGGKTKLLVERHGQDLK